ncbi:hypothetical protein [Acetonema longum]|nr:hypothetical protein [Acetonema longum]
MMIPQARSASVRAAPSQAAACLPSAARPAAPLIVLPREAGKGRI